MKVFDTLGGSARNALIGRASGEPQQGELVLMSS
jgi:hypothetical protein